MGLCYNGDMKRKTRREGFTLIELALSLVFIGILSITVVLLIQNVSASYRRGLILNQVNTVGMDLIDDFRSSIQNATSDPVTRMCGIYYDQYNIATARDYGNCINDNAMSFIMAVKYANVTDVSSGLDNESMPVFGAFCTGTYTYVWNSGYFDYDDGSKVSGVSKAVIGTRQFSTSSLETRYSDFRLLKIYDDDRSICVNSMKESSGSTGYTNYADLTSRNSTRNEFVINGNISDENGDPGVELLKNRAASDLVLYDLYVARPALSSTRQNMFYAASFILGTTRGGVNIKQAGNSCKPPADDDSMLDYCAINKFNFAVQAGGK